MRQAKIQLKIHDYNFTRISCYMIHDQKVMTIDLEMFDISCTWCLLLHKTWYAIHMAVRSSIVKNETMFDCLGRAAIYVQLGLFDHSTL